jgi:hypothetical protein
MLLIGATPPNRNIEQHDIFFGIAEELKDLVPAIKNFWPECKGKLHIDAWREVTLVDGYSIRVFPTSHLPNPSSSPTSHSPNPTRHLFFLNLGGYKPNEFEEFHYKMIVVAADKGEAIARAKETAFYKHTGFKGATSHIDDKYGVDVDDVFEITDILSRELKEQYNIVVEKSEVASAEDEVRLGYFKLDKL